MHSLTYIKVNFLPIHRRFPLLDGESDWMKRFQDACFLFGKEGIKSEVCHKKKVDAHFYASTYLFCKM